MEDKIINKSFNIKRKKEDKEKIKNEKEINKLKENIKKNEDDILNLNKLIFEIILNNNIKDKVINLKEEKIINEENFLYL